MKKRATERWALGAIESARMFVPDYGRRPLREEEVDRLLAAYNVAVFRPDMPSAVAILGPPWMGKYQLGIAAGLPRDAVKYVKLHELAHVLGGDILEPTIMQFTGPLPEAEEAADLFALAGVVAPEDVAEGREWTEHRIRQLVPLDNYGWQTYRIPRLAGQLVRFRKVLDDYLD